MVSVRRFEAGFSTDLYGIQAFLSRHGYELHAKYLAGFTITGAGKRIKSGKWSAVIAFVDEIRISSGLEPIRRETC